jgi:transcriptional regulator with XRE-family HTH domain
MQSAEDHVDDATPNAAKEARSRLGAELRRLRKASQLSQKALAARLGYSRVYITTIENGHDLPGEEFVGLAAELLGGANRLNSLHEQGVEAHRAERKRLNPTTLIAAGWRNEPSGNGEASDVVLVEAAGPNGEVVLVSIDRRTALKQLGATAATVSLGSLLDRGRSSLDVAGQTPLEHLHQMYRQLIDSDNLFGSTYALQGTADQLRIVEQLCQTTTGADRRELLVLRAQLGESMAWLTQDQADYETASKWTDRALEWSLMINDPLQTAIVLVRKSQLAADIGDGAAALDYAIAIENLGQPQTRLPAVAHLCAAHGHALIGSNDASAEAYDTARDLIESLDLDPSWEWGGWLDHAYVDAQQARSLVVGGDNDASAVLFDRALSAIPEHFPRERGVHLARAARTQAGAGEFERAATLGTSALETGQIMRSGRIDNELRLLLKELDQVDTVGAIEFRELARSSQLV